MEQSRRSTSQHLHLKRSFASTSSSFVSARSESMTEGLEDRECSNTIEEQIERHWSLLSEPDSWKKGRTKWPKWTSCKFSRLSKCISSGVNSFQHLVMILKYCCVLVSWSGQAELFHAHVTCWDPNGNERDLEHGREWVVKVFKKGTFLHHLQEQLPHGLLQLKWMPPKT